MDMVVRRWVVISVAVATSSDLLIRANRTKKCTASVLYYYNTGGNGCRFHSGRTVLCETESLSIWGFEGLFLFVRGKKQIVVALCEPRLKLHRLYLWNTSY